MPLSLSMKPLLPWRRRKDTGRRKAASGKGFPGYKLEAKRPLDDYVALILAERYLQEGQVDINGR